MVVEVHATLDLPSYHIPPLLHDLHFQNSLHFISVMRGYATVVISTYCDVFLLQWILAITMIKLAIPNFDAFFFHLSNF